MKKFLTIVFAVLTGLGFYACVSWFSYGITPSRVMSIIGVVIVAAFVEARYSINEGIRMFLEVGRDVLGGLGSMVIINLLPITLTEELSVVIMLICTAVIAITVSDDYSDDGDDSDDE